MKPKTMLYLVKETFSQWSQDQAPQLAAALAYYTIFSMAPLLLIAIAIAGAIFGQDAVRTDLFNQLRTTVGPQTAEFVSSMIANTSKPSASVPATIIGLVALFLGAAGVFNQLKLSLNKIWNVPDQPNPGGIKGLLKPVLQQFLSFAMVLGTGFLLLVSLLLSTVLAALGEFVGNRLPIPASFWELLNFILSFAVITVLFAAIFKVLPDRKIKWHHVWIGGAVTALLFTVGKMLLGWYLGQSSVASAYGAAGSLVVILLWVYYSAQILFLGAEFTQVYTTRNGPTPTLNPELANRVEPPEKTPQGREPLLLPPGPPRKSRIRQAERLIAVFSPLVLLALRAGIMIGDYRNRNCRPKSLKS